MAITFDGKGQKAFSLDNPISASIDIDSNAKLVVLTVHSVGFNFITIPTLDGVSMSKAGEVSSVDQTVQEWYILNDSISTGLGKIVSMDTNGSNTCSINVSSYIPNNTSNNFEFNTFYSASGNGTDANVSASNLSSDTVVIDGLVSDDNTQNPDFNQTLLYRNLGTNELIGAQYHISTGTSNINMWWESRGDDDWGVVAASFDEITPSGDVHSHDTILFANINEIDGVLIGNLTDIDTVLTGN